MWLLVAMLVLSPHHCVRCALVHSSPSMVRLAPRCLPTCWHFARRSPRLATSLTNSRYVAITLFHHLFCNRRAYTARLPACPPAQPSLLNKRLKGLMPGLSAKVFRTYNASVTLEKELPDMSELASAQEKVNAYDKANREVAILCNHQRTVPAKFKENFAKLEARVQWGLGSVVPRWCRQPDVK